MKFSFFKRKTSVYEHKLKWKHILLAILFSLIYVNVPWEELAGREFKDRQNYITYIEYGQSVLTYLRFENIIDYVTAEWLWHYMLDELVRSGQMTPEQFFLVISFSLVFLYALIVLGNASPLYLFLLVNPLVVDFGFTQLRHALAMVFIALSIFSNRNVFKIILISISALIHTSSVLFVGIFYASKYLVNAYQKSEDLLALRMKVIGLGLSLSIVLGPAMATVLSLFGDRRAVDRDLSSTVLYLSIWIMVSAFLLFKLNKRRINELTVFTLILVTTVAFNALTGGYSLRVLSVVFPFFLVTLANTSLQVRLPILVAFAGYSFLQWLFWLRLI